MDMYDMYDMYNTYGMYVCTYVRMYVLVFNFYVCKSKNGSCNK